MYTVSYRSVMCAATAAVARPRIGYHSMITTCHVHCYKFPSSTSRWPGPLAMSQDLKGNLPFSSQPPCRRQCPPFCFFSRAVIPGLGFLRFHIWDLNSLICSYIVACVVHGNNMCVCPCPHSLACTCASVKATTPVAFPDPCPFFAFAPTY